MFAEMEMLRTVIVALFFAGITVSSYYFLSSSPFPWENRGMETVQNGISPEAGIPQIESGGERTFAQDGPFAPPASAVSMEGSELPQLNELLPENDQLSANGLASANGQLSANDGMQSLDGSLPVPQNGLENAAPESVNGQEAVSGYAQEMNAGLGAGEMTMPLKAPESNALADTQSLPPLENAPVSPFDSAPNVPEPVAVQPEIQIGAELNSFSEDAPVLPQSGSGSPSPMISGSGAGTLPMPAPLSSEAHAAPALSDTESTLPADGLSVPEANAASGNAPAIAPANDGLTNPLRSQSAPASPASNVSSMNAPSMNAPSMNASSMNAPSMNAPSMNAPSMNAPSMNASSMNAPSANAPSASETASAEPAIPAENALPLPSASEMPENVSSAAPSAGTSEDQAVREYLKTAAEKMQKGEALEVLRAMSRFYGDSRYSAEDLAELTNILVQAATQVIYSQQSFLEPAYVIQPGDTLEKIAAQYQIPAEFIARVNGLQAPYELQPGTQLKVVRGPFQAIVWLDRHEMVLTLRGLFAGRFWIGVGGDLAVKDGDFQFGRKMQDPASLSGGNGFEFMQFAGEGNPTLKVHAADASQIGTNAPSGGILMTQVDIDSLGALLGPGSQLIMRCVSPKCVVKSSTPTPSASAVSTPAVSAPGPVPVNQAVGTQAAVAEPAVSASPAAPETMAVPVSPEAPAAPMAAPGLDGGLPDALPGTMPAADGLNAGPTVIPAEGGAGELPDELPPML